MSPCHGLRSNLSVRTSVSPWISVTLSSTSGPSARGPGTSPVIDAPRRAPRSCASPAMCPAIRSVIDTSGHTVGSGTCSSALTPRPSAYASPSASTKPPTTSTGMRMSSQRATNRRLAQAQRERATPPRSPYGPVGPSSIAASCSLAASWWISTLRCV